MTPSFLWILFSTPFFSGVHLSILGAAPRRHVLSHTLLLSGLPSFLQHQHSMVDMWEKKYSSTVSLDTFAGGLHGVIDVEEESAQAQARRAAKGSAALMDMFLKDKGKSVKHAGPDEETFYQPYWDGGHWVFFRPPTTTVVTREGQYIRPTTTKMYDPKKPTKTPAVVTSHHCNRACLQIYKDYGTVCGRLFRIKYSSEYWDYLYRTFDNICALENYSCNDENKTYQLIYKGPCRQKEASWQESTDTMANGPLVVPQGGYGVMDETKKVLDPFNKTLFTSHYYYNVGFPQYTLTEDYD